MIYRIDSYAKLIKKFIQVTVKYEYHIKRKKNKPKNLD